MIRPPENVDEIFNIQCYPTTFYISRDGKFLGEPTEGADVDEYGYRLDQYLSGADSSQSVYRTRTAGMTAGYGTEKNVMPNDAGAYRVFVADEKGNPVQGAAVQFCSDSQLKTAWPCSRWSRAATPSIFSRFLQTMKSISPSIVSPTLTATSSSF